MKPIPLPSHVHYELLLQLLERKTLAAVEQPALRQQVLQVIISLRKAYAQQKQLEDICQQTQIPFECRWSLNSMPVPLDEIDSLTSETTNSVNHS